MLHPWRLSLLAKLKQYVVHTEPEAKQGAFAGIFPTHRGKGVVVSAVLCSLLLRPGQEKGEG